MQIPRIANRARIQHGAGAGKMADSEKAVFPRLVLYCMTMMWTSEET